MALLMIAPDEIVIYAALAVIFSALPPLEIVMPPFSKYALLTVPPST